MYDDLMTGLLVSAILTIVSYLSFPLIRLAINRGRFEKEQAHKICLWNSIIVGAIFCVLTVAVSGSAWNASPAFLYYWINRAIITKRQPKKQKKVILNNEPVKQHSSAVYYSNSYQPGNNYGSLNISGDDVKLQKEEKEEKVLQKIIYCRKCGHKLSDGSIFCSNCGFKITN